MQINKQNTLQILELGKDAIKVEHSVHFYNSTAILLDKFDKTRGVVYISNVV
jgi:hypothetical protein